MEGLTIPKNIELLISSILVLHFLMVFMWYGLAFFFSRAGQEKDQFLKFQWFNLFTVSIQIAINMFCKKNLFDRKIEKVNQIISHYLGSSFWMDGAWILTIIFDLSFEWEGLKFVRLVAFFKCKDILKKVEHIEASIIKSFEMEQYWGVIKVFLINFLMAHCIGILLMSMTEFSSAR